MNYSFSPGVNFNVEIEEKLDCDISYYPSFNRSFGNLVAGAGDYFSQSISTSLKYKISKVIELKTDLKLDYQGAENAFSKNSIKFYGMLV
jgi:curved DNA-binding protein CbpA